MNLPTHDVRLYIFGHPFLFKTRFDYFFLNNTWRSLLSLPLTHHICATFTAMYRKTIENYKKRGIFGFVIISGLLLGGETEFDVETARSSHLDIKSSFTMSGGKMALISSMSEETRTSLHGDER